MARIRQEDVEAVRDRTDAVKLVEQYVSLKKAGRSFTGLCPFHTEKTPSFTVDPGKGVYYCFGCGKGGNVFHFVMEVEGLTFPEAVERLSRSAGVTLRYEGGGREDDRKRSRREALYRANDRAADLYHRMLLEGREAEDARSYLQSRGITKESVERFRIGYAPGYPDFLLRRMTKDFSPDLLTEAGLAMQGNQGGIRDRFRARVIFPVGDLAGRTVGFGARLLQGDGPKYLNSPETPIYRKGEMLYNLDRAKGDIGKGGVAYVVEGYTDVIWLSQAGVDVAVATCGTALTEAHFRLLSRFAQGGTVVLSFDSDDAGARAAERAYGLFEDHPIELRVLILSGGLDPADFVQQRGPEAFREEAAGALPLVEFILRREVERHDTSTAEGKARAVREAMPVVLGLRDEVRRSQYGGALADLVGEDPKTVLYEIERAAGAEGRGEDAPQPQRGRQDRRRQVETEALKLLAQAPDAALDVAKQADPELFETERHRRAFELLRDHGGGTAQTVERATEAGFGELIAQLTLAPLTGEGTTEYAEQVFARLEELSLGQTIADMKKRLERLHPASDPQAYDSMFEELIALEARRRSVRARAGEGA